MSGGLGSLTVDLLLNSLGFTSGLTKAEHQAEQFSKAMDKSMSNVGASIASAAKQYLMLAAASFTMKEIIQSTAEAEEATIRLQFAVERLGAGTDITAANIEQLADAMSAVTTFDDEAIKNGAASMLRFGAISQSVMTRALELTADFAAASKTDFETASEAIGKALVSPDQGLNRLQRTIGYIDDSTKEYIKTLVESGELIAAQNKLLSILEQRVGGTAEVMNNTLSGALANTKKGFSDLAEEIGKITVVDAIIRGFFEHLVGSLRELTHIIKEGNIQNFFEFVAGWRRELEKPVKPPQIARDIAKEAEQAALVTKKFNEQLAEQDEKLIEVAKKNQEKRAKDRQKILDDMVSAEKKAVDMMEEAHELGNKFILNEEKKRLKEMEEANKNYYDSIVAQEKILQEARDLGNKFIIDQAKKRNDELEKEWGGFMKGVDEAGRAAFDSLFEHTEGGWDDMLNTMKKALKRTLVDYVYTAFVKPIILKFLAQGGAGSGLGDYASNLLGGGGGGGGGIMDSIMSYFSGDSSMTSNFSSLVDSFGNMTGVWDGMTSAWSEMMLGDAFVGPSASLAGGSTGMGANITGGLVTAGYGIAGGFFGNWAAGAYGAGDRGVANATNYAATGAAIGSMTPLGPIGAAIGAVLGTIIGISTDPDPDAMRAAVFGRTTGVEGLTDWKGKGAFGEFGFSAGEWLSDADMGESFKEFIKGMENMDNAIAKFMSPEQIANVSKRLDEATKRYELGMEHGAVMGLADIAKDRLSIMAHELNDSLGDFVDGFSGPFEQLIGIVDSYLIATGSGGFGAIEAAIEALEKAPATMMETYQANLGTLRDYVGQIDASGESLTYLNQSMAGFQMATIQLVLAIDAASESMHNMFTSTAEAIQLAVMDNEGKYKYYQDQADELFAQLLTETDPAKIHDLAAKINEDINKAFGLLDPDQQQAMAQDFLDRIAMVDTTIADKMQGLRDVVMEDAETVMDQVVDRLATLFTQADTTAQVNANAAVTMQDAANTLAQTVITVEPDAQPVVNGG